MSRVRVGYTEATLRLLSTESAGGSRPAPPLPLGHVRAVEQAIALREDGLTYLAISVVMARYHGARRKPEWWRRVCRQGGAAPKYHGTQSHLKGGSFTLYKVDREVLEAITGCPLTVLQLRYKLGGALDRYDRSLARLVELGLVDGAGSGLERRWRAR